MLTMRRIGGREKEVKGNGFNYKIDYGNEVFRKQLWTIPFWAITGWKVR